MRPTDDQDDRRDDEELVARLVAAAGPRPELPDALRVRWEESFKASLAEELGHRSRWRQLRLGGAVAAGLAATLALTVVLVAVWTPTKAHPAAQVAALTGTVESSHQDSMEPGVSVQVGETIRTGPSASIAFRYRDADVRLSGDTVLEFHAARVTLRKGSVYVDSGLPAERNVGAPAVMVETSRGSLTHLGTQFLVTLTDDALLAAVREGSIALRTDRFRREFTADVESAAMVRVDDSGELVASRIEPSGGIWAWVPVASPGVAHDERNAASLLAWIGRETGRTVSYATPAASAHAAGTELGGVELTGVPVDDVLAAVIGTTRLSVAQSGSAMVVSLEGDEDPH